MFLAYLSLGSNLGDRFRLLQEAISGLQKKAGRVKRISSFYETEPVGKTDQPFFLNVCVELTTKLKPQALLKICQAIEYELGRRRKEKWGPRTADLDLLLYGNHVINTPKLILPHPEISKRRFVLVPLAEIAPNSRHPILKKSIRELLKECADTSIVRALHGYPSTQKTRHAIQD
jgi:2-amino-4-hydroxy-6-hydroxymethyldihydropteridine diphosphokinase